MLIALDIGNTNIKSVLYEEDQSRDLTIHSSLDEAIDYINRTNFNQAAICSVNPVINKILSEDISSRGISTFQADTQQKFNLTIQYETPSTLGMDRLCSAVGALEIATKKNIISKDQFLITIDLGTATTINIVSPDKQFIGGLIAPGINTMLNSLNDETAQLPLTKAGSYKGLIGSSTNSSIVSGVITSTIGLINESVNYLYRESKHFPLVFATGGNAKIILPYLKHQLIYEESLVLRGLKVIYDLNN